MWTTLLALLPLVAAPQDEGSKPPPPDPARVAAALESLETAMKRGEVGDRVRAIEGAADLADAEVLGWIARGLGDKQPEVRAAAVAALRYQPHPAALKALEDALRKAPRSPDEDKAVAELVLAVGQHASPGSLALLTAGGLDRTRSHTTRARIQALGRVRDPRAVEELIALMNKAGNGRLGGGQLFDGDLRLSLWALTGTDEGPARESWMRWWNDHKRDFGVAPEVPEEPRALAARWKALWETPAEREARQEKRREGKQKREGEDRDGDDGRGPRERSGEDTP